jgi:2-keto-4-pentenoate hydratase/2-oxohepta-3-ene-1,7-dioic acid hydratase in catechol pathway
MATDSCFRARRGKAWFVTEDQIADSNNLDLRLMVNSDIRWGANTRDLMYNMERLIECASSFSTLLSGDRIFTSTPEGVSPVKPDGVPNPYAG